MIPERQEYVNETVCSKSACLADAGEVLAVEGVSSVVECNSQEKVFAGDGEEPDLLWGPREKLSSRSTWRLAAGSAERFWTGL